MQRLWGKAHGQPGRIERRLSLGVLAVLLVCCRCAPFLPMAPAPMDATPEQITAAVTRNVEGLNDLEAKMRVHIDFQEVQETATARVLFRKPDWLKIEVKGPLGVTVATVLMRGDTVRAYYPLSKVLLEGKPTAEHFEVMTGMQIDVADFRSLLAGQGGLAGDDLEAMTEFFIEERQYVLSSRVQGHFRRYWIDPKKLLITRSESYDDQGALDVRQIFRRYKNFSTVQLPTKIDIEKVREHQRVQMTLLEGTVNEGIAEDRFELNVPADVERIELSH